MRLKELRRAHASSRYGVNSTRPRMRNAWRPDYARLPDWLRRCRRRTRVEFDLNGSATARDALKRWPTQTHTLPASCICSLFARYFPSVTLGWRPHRRQLMTEMWIIFNGNLLHVW